MLGLLANLSWGSHECEAECNEMAQLASGKSKK